MSDINNNKRHDENSPITTKALERERYELLHRLENWLETPMLILAFIWLGLLVAELVWGENLSFEIIGTVIWIIFILSFIVDLVLAPHKMAYVKKNWLLVISLLVPALRIFRIFRVFRLVRLTRMGRGLQLFRVISSTNRSMRALSSNLERRGFRYVLAITVLVTFAGAAGMYAFERQVPNGLNSYGEALWWTSMIMTTMGSQYWPETLEGRILCVFLALYAFGVFGYVTATLATYFVGQDADNVEAELAGARELAELRKELSLLRDEIQTLTQRPPGS